MLKHFITTIFGLVLTLSASLAQTTIHQQDFSGQNGKGTDDNGTDITGVNWTLNTSNGNFTASNDYFMVKNEVFEAQDTDGQVEWVSDTFNISGYSNLKVNWDAKASGDFEANSDVFKVLAFIDNNQYPIKDATVDESIAGDPMFFGNTQLDGTLKNFSEAIGQTGSNCYIKIIVMNNAASELCGWDNLKVTGTSGTLPEPANQPSAFTASASSSSQIDLSWTDATAGSQKPDGYLIKASDTNNISQPTDGNDPALDNDLSDGSAVVKKSYGSGNSQTFQGLSKNTQYHFQIWSYTNSGSSIDFLTSTAGPSDTALTPSTSIIAAQNFDNKRSWGYSSDQAYFSHKGTNTQNNVYPDADGWNGDGFYGIINLPDASGLDYSALSDSLLGERDLDDEGDFGTSGDANTTFEYVNLSGYNNVSVSFDYDVEGYNASSDVAEYEVFYDNSGQGKVTLNDGSTPDNTQGTVNINVPSGTDSVKLVITINNNGISGYSGFDNFKIDGQSATKPEPSNHPTSFSATNTNKSSVKLQWCDVTSTPKPDGYLILGKTANGSFKNVTDSNPVSNDTNWSDQDGAANVSQGVENYTFAGLSTNTNYHFKIYPYTNSGSDIDYKTTNVPSTQVSIRDLIAMQDFEGSGSWNYSTTPATCNDGGQDYWQVRNQADGIQPVSGNHLFGFKDLVGGTCGNSGLNNTLTFSTLGYQQLRSYKNMQLAFQYRVFEYDNGDEIQYELIYNGQSAGKQVLFDGASNKSTQSCNENWVTKKVTIPDSVYTLQLKLHVDQNGSGDYAALDNFRLKGDSLTNITKKWDGQASDNSWYSAANWAPDGVPGVKDSVILDHTYKTGAYTVRLANQEPRAMSSLHIEPGSGDSIMLKIPQTNTHSPALTTNNPFTPLSIGDKGKLVNASGATSGSAITLNDSLAISNGGTYLHQTTSAHAELVRSLSGKISTKKGKFIFRVNSTAYPIAFSGVHYGQLQLSSTHANNSAGYQLTGNANVNVRNDLTIGANTELDLVGFNGQIQVQKDLHVDSAGNLTIAGDLPAYFSVGGNKNIHTKAGFILTGSGMNTGFNAWGIQQAGLLARDGSGTITLDNDLTVHRKLRLTNGHIGPEDHKLTLAASATVSGGSSSSYVKINANKTGTLTRPIQGSGYVLFPVGYNPYAPVEIQCSSCTGEKVAVSVRDQIHDNPETRSTQQTNNIVNQTWSVTPSKAINGADLRFSWEASQESGFNGMNAYVASWEQGQSTQWNSDSTTVSTNTLKSAKTQNKNLNANKYYFGIGDNNSPLPVELLYFRVNKKEDQSALLNWATASETNNRLFRIQHRTGKGANWSVIGTKQGQGTSTTQTNYEFSHDSAGYRTHYYRLKQVDFNGDTSLSSVKTIAFEREALAIEPHYHLSANDLTLSIESGSNKRLQLQVLSASGKTIINRSIRVKPGINQIPMRRWTELEPGVYVLKLQQGDQQFTKKLIR